MKRFLALAALVLGLASCQTEPEGLNVNVGGEVDTTITVTIPDTETRAGGTNSAKGVFDNGILSGSATMRYIFQVYYNNNEEVVESLAAPQVAYSDGQTVTFPVRLVPGRNYTFVVWADVVDAEADVDKHYITRQDGKINLRNITVNSDSWVAMDESRDAFTVSEVVADYNGAKTIELKLKRPFAKLRVITTDMKALNDLGIEPTYATVTYSTKHYSTFNAVDGSCSGEIANKTHNYFITPYADHDGNTSKVLFTDYFFANKQDEVVNFTLAVYDEQGYDEVTNTYTKNDDYIIKTNNFNTPIPAQRNYLTTISGNVLTDGNNINVTVIDGFENAGNLENTPYYQETISSVAELLAAIDANNGEYILISDLDVNGVTASALAATRATGTGAGTTINLNGYTITLKADINVPAGKTLIINDEPNDEGNEEGTIISAGGAIVNKGTLNIEGGSFGADTIENKDNGVINITGGEFKDNDLSDFVPDGYDVEENEDGSYTVTESEPVAKIGDVQYTTLQAAFDAVVGEATITLLRDATFKNTSVLAEGKTATLDLNGKTLAHTDEANQYALSNLGTLTITGNGTVNSRGIYNGYSNGGENVATAKLTIVNGSFNAKGTNGGAAVFNYGTVNVNGGEFTSIGGYSLNNQSGASMTIEDGVTANNGVYATGATLTINGGEISGNRSGCHVIYANNSTVTINGGTLYNNNSGNSTVMAAGTTKITYNGGTYGIKDGRVPGNGNTWTSCLLDSQSSAEVVVNNGTYNGGFRVQAGTSMTINGGSFNDCYGSNYNINGTVTVKGGTYTDAAAIAFAEKYVAEGYVLDGNEVVKDVKVAKVGTTEYRNIDAAIAAWTNNSTLTLLADVTLSDVVTLKSTEYHILDLGTYTMTAAKGKDAISITAEGRSSASYALDIKADATNPGGITATSKAVVKTTGKSGVKDRPIIRFYNGVYNASNVISHSGSNGTNCPQFQFYNGVYNASISANRALIQIYGGTFNGRFYTSVDSSAYMLISGGKFKYLDNLYGSALNSDKFTIGSAKGVFDRGIYVDDEGYFVVGGAVITEFGDMFAAKATNASKAGSYLPYSSAASNGLYYTNAEMAITKHGEANVVLK